ncbi:MAG: sulfatase-like hydrolase/transferase [Phycisphaerales bacterium]|nr:MAG: sulfatase-like hydrolase/transferase [Phycisphaerales bacterium]
MSSLYSTRRDFIKAVGSGAAALAVPGCASITQPRAGKNKRPNIVLMMADDMGYSDIGCYGGEIHTPNLDALAAGGLRFTQFYNTARCCPTRASLMTGLYQHQAGVGHMMEDKGHESYRGDLNNRCVTIAEALKQAGYNTYMSGKWHVTRYRRPEGPKHNWPRQRGFDRFFGTIHGAGSFYDPCSLTRDNTQIPPDSDDFYYTDAISDNAVKFVREHDSDNPFFMYVAYTAPHWPMHALSQDIARYKGRYAQGWDALRAERHKRMVEMGIVKREWKITPRDRAVPAWEEAEDKKWHERRMEVYAAMVDRLDQGVGRIIAELKRKGRFNNTLVFFLADNGGCAEEYGSRGAIKPDPSEEIPLRPMDKDALQPDMQPKVTRDGRRVRTGKGVMPGPPDTYIAYGKPWANSSNTPFRLYKHWVHEGGISTPLIAHWPARIRTGGKLRHQPGHLIDIMATCVDVAGAEYPAEYRGHRIAPMEGKSLRPVFDNKPIEREAIYWEHEGNRAVRQGKWKLVSRHPGGWELYDLEADRTELNNLAGEHPEKVEHLKALYEAWATRCGVQPWPVNKPTNNKRKNR